MSATPIDVPCPACGRQANEKCLTMLDGTDVGWTHDARHDAARDKREAET